MRNGYVVMIREKVMDLTELELYGQNARLAREGHDITRLAFYGEVEVLEGPPIEGSVILSFPSVDEARHWYNSPAYQKALSHRLKGAEYRVFIVEGVDDHPPSS